MGARSHPQVQTLGIVAQVCTVCGKHRLCRFLPQGGAVDHPGTDLVPFAAVSLGVGSVPERSVFVPVLDLRHRHHVLLGARDVLWLVVPLWRLDRNRLSRLRRSEEHTSELQSLMRISYAVFCLKKK